MERIMTKEERTGLLSALDTKTKLIGLISIVVEATLLASIARVDDKDVVLIVVIAAVIFIICSCCGDYTSAR